MNMPYCLPTFLPKIMIWTFFSTPEPYQKVVRISNNGKLLISGGDDGILRVWTFPELNPIHEIEAHDKEIDDVEFSPDNTKVYNVVTYLLFYL